MVEWLLFGILLVLIAHLVQATAHHIAVVAELQRIALATGAPKEITPEDIEHATEAEKEREVSRLWKERNG